MRRALILLSAFAAGADQVLLAISPQDGPPPTFRAAVDVVTFDVTVLDRHNRPVRGLTASDFRVTIDGEARPIVGFDAVELPDRISGAAGWLRDVPPDVSTNGFRPDRIVVLLLDDWNAPEGASGAIAVRKIGRAILDELGPADLIAVVYPFINERGVGFTTDRRRLGETIDKFTSAKLTMPGPGGACPDNSCVLHAMEGIARATRAWPDRRKLLIYVSPQGYYQYGPSNIEQNNSEANAASYDSTPDLMRVFRELQRANVAVYQFDPRGIEEQLPGFTASSTMPTGGVSGVGGSVGMFADHTGGWTVRLSNAPWARAPQVIVENNSYYMLGALRTTKPTRDGFHPIRVTVNRPDVTLRVRAGFYDTNDAAEAKAAKALPQTKLDTAMIGPVPAQDLPLQLSVAPFRVSGARNSAVAVIGGLDRAASAADADRVDIAVRAFDERQGSRASKGLWTSTLRLRPEPASLTKDVHYDTLTRLDLPPGQYEVRLSMQRASDEVAGGVVTSITVPDFERERLSLSGVVLGRLDAPPLPSGHPMSALLPFSPTTRRQFSAREGIGALVRIYQGGRDAVQPATVTARIVNARDETLVDQTSNLRPADFGTAARTADFRLPLPLAKLMPGEYLLTLEAQVDRAAPIAKHVRFAVK
jgi:VWFA-related protein